MESLMSHWNPSWDNMPWKAFSSPVERFKVMPTFVVGESMGIAMAFLFLVHAAKQGRAHVVTLVLALVTGAMNDAIFMALPIVDNFWQAQACVMLTPRMPLYIPAMYIVFMYAGVVSAWRLRLAPTAEAAVAGIMAELCYSVYDITGNKFSWWTWHDTDAPIRVRNFGAPVGSTVWVITFTACFAFLVRKLVLGPPEKSPGGSSPRVASLGGLLVACLSTPLMMVQMALLQAASGDSQGLPTNRSFAAVILIYGGFTLLGLSKRSQNSDYINPSVAQPSFDTLLRSLMVAHYVFHLGNMLYSNPENSINTGVHQTVGPCAVTALDLAGQERQVFLCVEDFQEDFQFECNGRDVTPPDGSEWYTVCGTAHTNWTGLVAAQLALAAVGISVYSAALTPSDKERRAQRRPRKKDQ